mmetsp:Transcript_90884/g.252869  ORF Transcript_90884/g.252869 Transcript_90884/m.252869 type:complete len:1031 (+) Transcript_90884:47-3139(+)
MPSRAQNALAQRLKQAEQAHIARARRQMDAGSAPRSGVPAAKAAPRVATPRGPANAGEVLRMGKAAKEADDFGQNPVVSATEDLEEPRLQGYADATPMTQAEGDLSTCGTHQGAPEPSEDAETRLQGLEESGECLSSLSQEGVAQEQQAAATSSTEICEDALEVLPGPEEELQPDRDEGGCLQSSKVVHGNSLAGLEELSKPALPECLNLEAAAEAAKVVEGLKDAKCGVDAEGAEAAHEDLAVGDSAVDDELVTLLHPVPVNSLQEVSIAQEEALFLADEFTSAGERASETRKTLAQVVEEAKACLAAEQQAEDVRLEGAAMFSAGPLLEVGLASPRVRESTAVAGSTGELASVAPDAGEDSVQGCQEVAPMAEIEDVQPPEPATQLVPGLEQKVEDSEGAGLPGPEGSDECLSQGSLEEVAAIVQHVWGACSVQVLEDARLAALETIDEAGAATARSEQPSLLDMTGEEVERGHEEVASDTQPSQATVEGQEHGPKEPTEPAEPEEALASAALGTTRPEEVAMAVWPEDQRLSGQAAELMEAAGELTKLQPEGLGGTLQCAEPAKAESVAGTEGTEAEEHLAVEVHAAEVRLSGLEMSDGSLPKGPQEDVEVPMQQAVADTAPEPFEDPVTATWDSKETEGSGAAASGRQAEQILPVSAMPSPGVGQEAIHVPLECTHAATVLSDGAQMSLEREQEEPAKCSESEHLGNVVYRGQEFVTTGFAKVAADVGTTQCAGAAVDAQQDTTLSNRLVELGGVVETLVVHLPDLEHQPDSLGEFEHEGQESLMAELAKAAADAGAELSAGTAGVLETRRTEQPEEQRVVQVVLEIPEADSGQGAPEAEGAEPSRDAEDAKGASPSHEAGQDAAVAEGAEPTRDAEDTTGASPCHEVAGLPWPRPTFEAVLQAEGTPSAAEAEGASASHDVAELISAPLATDAVTTQVRLRTPVGSPRGTCSYPPPRDLSRTHDRKSGREDTGLPQQHPPSCLPSRAVLLGVLQRGTCLAIGATCALFTAVELAWHLGPEPQPFS